MNLHKFLNFEYRKRLPKEFGGAAIRVTPRADRRVLKPGWNGAAFDLQLVARKLIEPGMTVWDIGANQGIFSFMAAAKAGRKGQVFALEADPHYADLILRSSLKLGFDYADINVLCAAIANQRSILKFASSKSGHARNRLFGFGGEEQFEAEIVKIVVAVTGDELLDVWQPPQIVKMDVEGAELAALKGSRRLLREARPVFYIEVSEQNEAAVSSVFLENDYSLFHLEGSGNERPIERCTFFTIARPSRSVA